MKFSDKEKNLKSRLRKNCCQRTAVRLTAAVSVEIMAARESRMKKCQCRILYPSKCKVKYKCIPDKN